MPWIVLHNRCSRVWYISNVLLTLIRSVMSHRIGLRQVLLVSVIVLLAPWRAFGNTECDGPPGAPPSNAGTQFLLCFERNDVIDHDPFDSGYLEIDFAALEDAAVVTITCNRYPSMNRVFSL